MVSQKRGQLGRENNSLEGAEKFFSSLSLSYPGDSVQWFVREGSALKCEPRTPLYTILKEKVRRSYADN